MRTDAPLPNPGTPQRRKPLGRWGRAAAWVAGSLVVLLVLIGATVALLLRSTYFHNFLLNSLEKQASRRLGTQVQLENLTLHPRNLSIDIYGLTIQGAAPYRNPPLLQVQHAEVGVRIISILHRKWYLDSFRVDRPVLQVLTDAHGISNIPTLQSSGGGNSTDIFDLGIRYAVLDHGTVSYNDKESSLDADLQNVEFHSSFDSLLEKYSGSLSYTNGRLKAGSLRPVSQSFYAQFDATRTAFHLIEAKIATGQSQLMLAGTLEDYDHPIVQARYDAVLDGSDLRRILQSPSLSAGVVHADGSVRYQAIANRPFLDAVVLHGKLTCQQMEVRATQLHAQILDLAVQYSLENGDATVQTLRAHLLGGEVTATAKMTDLSGDSQGRLNAALHGVSLAELARSVRGYPLPRNLSVAGTLDVQTNATWRKEFEGLVARTDATANGEISGTNTAEGGAIKLPVSSAIHGTYSAATSRLELAQSYFRMPQTSLEAEGVVSNRSNFKLLFHSKDLGELETVADLFQPPAHRLQPLGLGGAASFQGTIQGTTAAPHLTGELTASQLKVKGTVWRELHTDVHLSPSFASLRNAELVPASRGRITLSASAGLRKWSFTNRSPITLTLTASQLNLSDLTKIAGTRIPVTGTVSANVQAHGTELSPEGQGKISLTQSEVYEQPIQSAQLTFAGSGAKIHGNLSLHLAAGEIQGQASLRPQQKSYSVQLTANQIHLDRVQLFKSRNVAAKGVLDLKAMGQGTFQNPQLNASLQIPQLEIENQTIRAVSLQVTVANHAASASLRSQALSSSIRGDAKIDLTGDYPAQATLDTQIIPLQPLFAIYAPSQASSLSGETELHATLNGPIKNKRLLEAHLTVPALKLAYGNRIQLSAVSPIRIDYKDGMISVQRGAIRGTDTDLQFEGSIPASSNAPMSLMLLGTVNLELAQLFDTDIRSSGELKFNINSHGPANGSNLAGQINIVNANFSTEDLPLALQNGTGVLTLTNQRLNITRFQANVGGGTVTAQGGVVYRPSMQFDLGLSAKNVRILYPQGVRESVGADLRLSGSMNNALLGGSVDLSDLSFTPAFDLTNFINQFSGGVAAPPTPGFSQNLQLDVSVHSSNDLNLVSRTLSVNGTANLQIRGTAAQPVILGRVNLNSGDLIFNGDRFVLNGGTIEFTNPSETEPVVNLALTTTIEEYDISMRFNGPVDQLRTNYSSNPALPAADIINLLAFGQTTEANSANPSTPANQEAESLVASQVSSQVTSRVSKIAGISQLSISPVLSGGSSQGPAGANITIQQRVTGNLFVTFSSNVASTQNQTIMGQYQLSPRVAVSATRDQSGGVALDTLIKKTW